MENPPLSKENDGKIGNSIGLFLQQAQKWKMGPLKIEEASFGKVPLKPLITGRKGSMVYLSETKRNNDFKIRMFLWYIR